MTSRHDGPRAHARAPRCHARAHQAPAPESSPCENPVQQQPSHPSRQRGPLPPPPRQEPGSTTKTAAAIPPSNPRETKTRLDLPTRSHAIAIVGRRAGGITSRLLECRRCDRQLSGRPRDESDRRRDARIPRKGGSGQIARSTARRPKRGLGLSRTVVVSVVHANVAVRTRRLWVAPRDCMRARVLDGMRAAPTRARARIARVRCSTSRLGRDHLDGRGTPDRARVAPCPS